MLKNLETGLAEREAMIRILQSNKTMSNSNLAAEIVNKAASGVVVGAPATSGISDTNSADTTSALRSMLLQTPSSLHMSGSHNLPQHQYQMSLVGSTTPASSATSILHNKTLSHLAHDPHQSLRHASTPSFSSRALLLPSNPPPPPPAPLPSVATSISMISSAMGHSKQLSTPITLGSSNAFKSISLNSTPVRNLSAFPQTNQLPTHSFLNQIHNANHPTPSNPLLLGRSMTPSADMLLLRSSATPLGHNPTSADILRSMTPGPTDLQRPPAYTSIGGDVANQLDQLTLKTAALRRESAPGGVFAANASTSHPMVSIGPSSGTK